ncbi:hypothetical protein D5E87_21855 [Vibrio parahaemolyticus]|uniref:Uncharacterized protein n=1 Tax=Vibrio alginolyticus TaxID=663 RepID=A0A7Y4EZZ3_VIBAL|nr:MULTISPECIES: hypothetical protein [Vibrio harveyi group]APX10186.1 hypothetical protein BWP24_28760 [Vibrio campbellii]EGQ8101411.1 hypothetical protein [Vibrio parahaemolyticus]EGQ8229661.1 hypothetical protein [Vibrio parahaemolyticus]EGQ8551685.1 hypothetical protein [Vibrio parahaemolyticus]EGQ9132695.1 hypothetical protein [Vibrio parahaemolyticus]
MAKEFYKHWRPNEKSEALVSIAQSIIEDYQREGYTLTLRQLYYQFVARDLIENSERSYKNLGTVITKARMAGLLDWEAIEDRNREHKEFWFQEDETSVIERLPNYIQFDQWDRQPFYVEVWVEKEALGNVVSRACDPYLVPHMSCKGYLSASEAWRAGKRYEQKLYDGKRCVLIHLGDHDPSGIDMTRDNRDRIDLFTRMPQEVEVVRLALNRDQIDQFNPPPNPAKITDSRAKEYIKRFGSTSWELDALEPQVMTEMIQSEIDKYIDERIWNEVANEQKDVEHLLSKLHSRWPDIKHLLEC